MHAVMRNVLFACASLAAFCSIASADPLSVAATTGDAPAPTTYLQGGLMAGGNDGYFTAGGSAELGKQVASILWVHAGVALGAADQLFATGNGSIMQARLGADLMGCNDNGALCAFVGADLGVQTVNYVGRSDPWFCDGDYSDCMGNPIDDHKTGALGVGRVGLDIGSKHLRWRPGIEASATTDGGVGVNLTQSLAYRF